MSKAVTNEEVEDVLSSIRRLVSEDKRPLTGMQSAPVENVDTRSAPADNGLTAAKDSEPEADRLVLTPALRVLPSQAEVAEDSPLDLGLVAREAWTPAPTTDDANDSGAAQDTLNDSGPMVLFPAVQAKRADPEMDALDTLVQDAIGYETRGIEGGPDEDDYGNAAFGDKDDCASGAAAGQTARDDAQDRKRGMPHSADDEDRDLQEDPQETTHSPDEDIARKIHRAQSERVLVPDVQSGTDDISVPDDVAPPVASTAPLTAKIAALEVALQGTHQEWEPDGDEADELVLPDAPSMAWEDDIDLDAKGEPLAAVADGDVPDAMPAGEPQAAAAAMSFTADDQVMDEEALRDLVSEIVRAELQGALGERITRNVRKLVRREIHRALTAQDLE